MEKNSPLYMLSSKDGPLCRLAPMAGISNIPFRLTCKKLGSFLTTSEEISSQGLVRRHQRTWELAKYLEEERPIAMQLLGNEAPILTEAAKILEEEGADMVDLNMGCPVAKIVKTGAGSALMKEPLKCAQIFRSIRKAISIPFTIKIRGGWDVEHVNAPEIAKIAESEGVDAITVHPRTRSQQFSGLAPWEIISQVVQTVRIPVTGNGDVKNLAQAKEMQKITSCTNVMIGRGALGQPWLFSSDFEKLSLKEKHQKKYSIIREHFALIEEQLNPKIAPIQMKKHLAWYIRSMRGAAQARSQVFSLRSNEEVYDFLDKTWERGAEVLHP